MFIFVTVLIDTIGFGIILPVTPQLIMDLTGAGNRRGLDGRRLAGLFLCHRPVSLRPGDRQSERSLRPAAGAVVFAVGIWLRLCADGCGADVELAVPGADLAGIAGAAHTTANAYVADISSPDKRAQNFGMIGAAFGVGFILGPAIGGLLGSFGPRAPFFAAAALALVNLAYGYFVLPESLPVEHRRPFSWKRANTIGTLLQMRRYPVVWGMAGAMFIWQLAHQVLPNTWAYYTKLKFGWSEGEIGLSLAFAGVTMAVVQGGLTRVIVPRIGEQMAVFVGLTVGALSFLGYALADRTWLMYACLSFASFTGLAYPSMNAIMSRQIPASAQGELQGGVASLYSLTAIIGPLLMTQLFGYFTTARAPVYFPGAAFVFASLLTVVSIALFARATRAARPASGDIPASEEVAAE